MRSLSVDEISHVSGANALVEGGAYYVASEVGAAFLEGAELGAIAGPGGVIIGGLAAVGIAALWEATN